MHGSRIQRSFFCVFLSQIEDIVTTWMKQQFDVPIFILHNA